MSNTRGWLWLSLTLSLAGCDADANLEDAGRSRADAGRARDGSTRGDAGASTADAARDDSGTARDGGPPGAPGCTGASDLLLCETFDGPLDTDLWEIGENHGGSVTIDTEHVARGTSALHVHTTAEGGSQATVTETATFPIAMNSFFVRAFVYATGPLPAGHADLFEATGQNDAYEIALAMGDDTFKPLYHDPASEYSVWPESSPPFPSDRWVCVEWELDDVQNEVHTFIDGDEVTEIAVDGTEDPRWTVPNYAAFTVGLYLFHDASSAAPSFDFWIDELAIDDARIGCER